MRVHAAPLVLTAVVLGTTACAPTPAQEEPSSDEALTTEQAQVPSIEGTYRLVSRELPDGSIQEPPDVLGLSTFTKEYRSLNLMWTDADGRRFSISYIARYSLTPTEYSETSLYRLVNDLDGGEPWYDLSGPSGTSAVTVEGGRIQFVHPLYQEPSVVFEGERETASVEGQLFDIWERVD